MSTKNVLPTHSKLLLWISPRASVRLIAQSARWGAIRGHCTNPALYHKKLTPDKALNVAERARKRPLDTESGGAGLSSCSATARWWHNLRSHFSLPGVSCLVCIEESGSEWQPLLQPGSQSKQNACLSPGKPPIHQPPMGAGSAVVAETSPRACRAQHMTQPWEGGNHHPGQPARERTRGRTEWEGRRRQSS